VTGVVEILSYICGMGAEPTEGVSLVLVRFFALFLSNEAMFRVLELIPQAQYGCGCLRPSILDFMWLRFYFWVEFAERLDKCFLGFESL